MTTHFTTYIDLPAPAKDINALLDHLAGVNPEEAFIDAVVSKDGTRLEVRYTSDDLTKTSTSGGELRITSHVRAISDEALAELMTQHKKRVDALGFADRRNTKASPQPRDAKGRFTKRK